MSPGAVVTRVMATVLVRVEVVWQCTVYVWVRLTVAVWVVEGGAVAVGWYGGGVVVQVVLGVVGLVQVVVGSAGEGIRRVDGVGVEV